MGPEVWVAIVAVFISGGAIGAVGTLLAQWIIRGASPPPAGTLNRAERDLLREEVAELHKHLRNMDARLDFTERLLDGALPTAPPPARMPAPEPRASVEEEERPAGAPDGGGDPAGR